jgi:hypothetical protein
MWPSNCPTHVLSKHPDMKCTAGCNCVDPQVNGIGQLYLFTGRFFVCLLGGRLAVLQSRLEEVKN